MLYGFILIFPPLCVFLSIVFMNKRLDKSAANFFCLALFFIFFTREFAGTGGDQANYLRNYSGICSGVLSDGSFRELGFWLIQYFSCQLGFNFDLILRIQALIIVGAILYLKKFFVDELFFLNLISAIFLAFHSISAINFSIAWFLGAVGFMCVVEKKIVVAIVISAAAVSLHLGAIFLVLISLGYILLEKSEYHIDKRAIWLFFPVFLCVVMPIVFFSLDYLKEHFFTNVRVSHGAFWRISILFVIYCLVGVCALSLKIKIKAFEILCLFGLLFAILLVLYFPYLTFLIDRLSLCLMMGLFLLLLRFNRIQTEEGASLTGIIRHKYSLMRACCSFGLSLVGVVYLVSSNEVGVFLAWRVGVWW